MTIFLAIISIFGLTLAAWVLKNFSPVPVCAICVGVSGTWIWLLLIQQFGYHIDVLVPAILMGGSVVGLAYQGEKRIPDGQSALLWKTLFLPFGFLAVYSVFVAWWFVLLGAVLGMSLLAFFFLSSSRQTRHDHKTIKTLEEKMKQCC